MPEQQQSRCQLRGHHSNMSDAMWRISRSKAPVNVGMYRTVYMMDYKPPSDNRQHPLTSTMDCAEKLTLDAQLKAKEFARPTKYEPVEYAEDPDCQEVQPPYPTRLGKRLERGWDTPPPFQGVQEDHQRDLNTVLPSAEICLPQYPFGVEPITAKEKEGERPSQQTDPCAMPDNGDVPCFKHELCQNWENYQQFLLETMKASHTQAREIKKLSLGCSVCLEDFTGGTEASTYQRDYVHWPKEHSGFCRAHRNFSNLLLEDGYYKENPWMSDYTDNYGIFLKKLNWKSWNPVSSFCSARNPVPLVSHGMPSQAPVAL